MEVEKLNIYQRVLGVMGDFPYLEKEDKRVNNQYRYASYDTLVLKLQPLLVKWRIICTTDLVEWSQDGNRTVAVTVVTMVSADDPTQRISVRSLGYGVDNQDKGPGKAITYGAKVGLLKLLNIPCGEDIERDLIDHEPLASPAPRDSEPDIGGFATLSGDALAADLKMFCTAIGWTPADLKKQAGSTGRSALVRTAQKVAKDHIQNAGTPDPNTLSPESTDWAEVWAVYRMAAMVPDDPSMSGNQMMERALELYARHHGLEPAGV